MTLKSDKALGFRFVDDARIATDILSDDGVSVVFKADAAVSASLNISPATSLFTLSDEPRLSASLEQPNV